MSLLGALNLGQMSLVTQQIGLQVTGNNISNANTPGYSRQTANITGAGTTKIGAGQYIGSGAMVQSIERQVNESLQESLRDASSSKQNADLQSSFLSRIEQVFNSVSDSNLDTRISDFFDQFSTLANNAQDSGQRSVVIQAGTSLASYIQGLRTQLVSIHDDADNQVQQLVGQANTLLQQVGQLNQQITTAEAGGGMANDLRDQRDQALSSLAEMMNITVTNHADGQVTVSVGSTHLVEGTTVRTIGTESGADATGKLSATTLKMSDNGAPLVISGGKIGALINVRDTHAAGAITALDTLASSLINTVNSVHSQGQGLEGFSNLTGATVVRDPTAALNAGFATTGLSSTPVNGTFNLNITDAATGQTTTRQIKIDFDAVPPTSLNSLAADLSGSGLVATVDGSGKLNIQSTNSNLTFNFSDDTSGVLSGLGLNTFFTGTDASNIAVNSVLTANPKYLAASRGTTDTANTNAKILASGYSAATSLLGGLSMQSYYTNYISQLTTTAASVKDEAESQGIIYDSIYAQREAVSGVSMDEEAVNLMKYQRAFQGSARFITVVDEMMQTVLGLIQ